jgi:hypothetical protein
MAESQRPLMRHQQLSTTHPGAATSEDIDDLNPFGQTPCRWYPWDGKKIQALIAKVGYLLLASGVFMLDGAK